MTIISKILQLFIIVFGTIGLGYMFPNEFYKLTYYTYLSNLLVVLFFIWFIATGGHTHKNPLRYRLKACVTICITLTFLVYALLLAPLASADKFYTLRNFSLHYIVPILTILDWILFDAKGMYKKIDPIIWTVLPFIYCVYSLIRGVVLRIPIPDEKHSPFPYFFLNIDKYGWSGFFVHFIGIVTTYIIIGYIMCFIKKRPKKILPR